MEDFHYHHRPKLTLDDLIAIFQHHNLPLPERFMTMIQGLGRLIGVVGEDGQRYLLRLGVGQEKHLGFIGRENRIYRCLAEKTGLPTPRVMAHGESHALCPNPYLVLTYLEGVAGDTLEWDLEGEEAWDKVYRQLGRGLRELHEQTENLSELGFLNRYPPGNWRESLVKDAVNRLETIQYPLPDETLQQTRDLLHGYAELLPIDPPMALLHRDFKLRNCIYSDSEIMNVVGMVDFEWAHLGDPLLDVASVEAADSVREALLEGYYGDRSPPDNLGKLLTYYRLVAQIEVAHRSPLVIVNPQGFMMFYHILIQKTTKDMSLWK